MQWYVCLIAIAAAVFLGRITVELVSRPLRTMLRLRRATLERMFSFQHLPLPRSREFAVSSREIHDYNQAVRNMREAQRTFSDLGAQMLALCESEPTIRSLIAFFGLDMELVGRELINLSEVYSGARTDSTELRHAIEEAFQAVRTALAATGRPSGDDLTKIRLEPMYLSKAGYWRNRTGPLGQPPRVSRQIRRSSHRFRQPPTEQTAAFS